MNGNNFHTVLYQCCIKLNELHYNRGFKTNSSAKLLMKRAEKQKKLKRKAAHRKRMTGTYQLIYFQFVLIDIQVV